MVHSQNDSRHTDEPRWGSSKKILTTGRVWDGPTAARGREHDTATDESQQPAGSRRTTCGRSRRACAHHATAGRDANGATGGVGTTRSGQDDAPRRTPPLFLVARGRETRHRPGSRPGSSRARRGYEAIRLRGGINPRPPES
jgi:hypothetical protein